MSRAGFCDKSCTDESHQDAEPFYLVRLFFQDEYGYQDGKKGREFVQNIGVGDVLQQGVEYE